MSTIQQRIAALKIDGTSIPVCPICEKVLAKRPVAFVNGKPWCRSCFILLMKIQRMERYAKDEPNPYTIALPNVNGGERASVYKGVLKENKAP